MKSRYLFGLFTGVVLLALAGCWRSSNAPALPITAEYETGPALSVAFENNEVHITPEANALASPVSLPDDVPVFPKSYLALAVRSPHGQFMEFTTASPSVAARKHYVEQLSANAWNLTSERNSTFTHELAATKAGRKLFILIDSVQDGTRITLSHNRGAS